MNIQLIIKSVTITTHWEDLVKTPGRYPGMPFFPAPRFKMCRNAPYRDGLFWQPISSPFWVVLYAAEMATRLALLRWLQ
jgi:hypothetical protein